MTRILKCLMREESFLQTYAHKIVIKTRTITCKHFRENNPLASTRLQTRL